MITEEKGYTPVEHDEPLPCPFCGSQPKLQQLAHRMSSVKRGRKYVQERVCILASTLTLTADTFWFKCPSCRCTTGPHSTTAAEAARHWNTRQPTGAVGNSSGLSWQNGRIPARALSHHWRCQMSNDGGPVFPMAERDDALRGMSLLDYFAGQALAGLIGQELSYERMAEVCYRQAEAMLSYKQNQQAVSESQQVALGIGGET